MHASVTCSIIASDDSNFMEHFNPMEKFIIRKMIIKMILATDMEKHFMILGNFKTSLPTIRKLKPADVDSKLLLFEIMLKCADLSHAAKKLDIHLAWTDRLVDELFYQGDCERDRGMVISTYCDRHCTTTANQQATFLNNIVIPLYAKFNEFLGNDILEEECVQQLERNHAYWYSRQAPRSSTVINSPKFQVLHRQRHQSKT